MSMYSTGEAAKMCGVTVRTVQYYDSRGILNPSELTEGGRRLYNEEDLTKLKTICFLRDLGLSINAIGDLMAAENSGKTLMLLLEQQQKLLEEETAEKKEKLERISDLKKAIRTAADFSVNKIGDIAESMENKKKLGRMRRALVCLAIPFGVLEWSAIILWIIKGWWWLFLIYLAAGIIGSVFILNYYYKRTVYICPECGEVFKPAKKVFVFANHTPRTRKLICPKCNKKSWCIEAYDDSSEKLQPEH
ncbi:MAG: MerR family transcriptional regulator [Lachnospiraceae bacterium]|nr:MerR family transcriptional regulator [Lachnospiraceae bacterium]